MTAPIEVEWTPDQFTALLADAEARGYRKAIDRLRTQAEDWPQDMDRKHPFHHAAEYLVHVEAAKSAPGGTQ
jgi:hypothetical protein